MRNLWFFKGSWLLQLLVGIGLSLCSFFIEYKVLLEFIVVPVMALCLAVILEVGKVSAIVWHHYLIHLSFLSCSGSLRLISWLFRLGLILFSLLCSQLFFHQHLNYPKPESGQVAAKKYPETELSRIDAWYHSRKKALAARHKTQYTSSEMTCNRQIVKLVSSLAKEDRGMATIFNDTHYEKIEQQLSRKKTACNSALERLQRWQAKEVEQLQTEYSRKRQEILSAVDNGAEKTVASGFAGGKGNGGFLIVDFLQITKSLFDRKLEPPEFVFLFSLLMSLLIEMGIILVFSTITASVAPMLTAQYEMALKEEVLMARVDGEAKRDEMTHQAAMERIRKAGIRTVKQAKATLSSP